MAIKIYTDGGCRGNQNSKKNNVGGWGAVLEFAGNRKELKGGELNTTNNRMELKAVIEGLLALKTKAVPVVIYSDSAYVVNAFEKKWLEGWKKNGWKNSSKETVENKDLWKALSSLYDKFQDVTFVKVKGHSGVPGNERADALVNEAMDELIDIRNGGEQAAREWNAKNGFGPVDLIH